MKQSHIFVLVTAEMQINMCPFLTLSRRFLNWQRQRLNRAGVWCSSTRLALGAAAASEKTQLCNM